MVGVACWHSRWLLLVSADVVVVCCCSLMLPLLLTAGGKPSTVVMVLLRYVFACLCFCVFWSVLFLSCVGVVVCLFCRFCVCFVLWCVVCWFRFVLFCCCLLGVVFALFRSEFA